MSRKYASWYINNFPLYTHKKTDISLTIKQMKFVSDFWAFSIFCYLLTIVFVYYFKMYKNSFGTNVVRLVWLSHWHLRTFSSLELPYSFMDYSFFSLNKYQYQLGPIICATWILFLRWVLKLFKSPDEDSPILDARLMQLDLC